MEHTVRSQPVKTLDQNDLLFARSILKDVRQLVKGIRVMVAVLLRFAAMGESITNYLRAWSEPSLAAEP